MWLTEAAGIIIAPLIMIFSLPSNAEEIVTFFREFTVEQMENVPMCRFASFDMKQLGNIDYTPALFEQPQTAPVVVPTKVSTDEEQLPVPTPPTITTAMSVPTSTSMTTPSLAMGNLRRRKEDSEIVELELEEEEEEEKEKKAKAKGLKKMALDGTKNIRDMFQKTKSKSREKLEHTDSILLRPEIPTITDDFQTEITSPKPSKYGKMEMSLLNFKNTYPKWNPHGDGKQQIQKFLDNVHAIQSPAAPDTGAPVAMGVMGISDIGMQSSLINHPDLTMSIPPSSSMLSSSILGYSTALSRDVQIEMEESQKENMQRSLLLFSANRIMMRQGQTKSQLFL